MPLDSNVIAPLDGSNNTGEMKAIIEVFDYILRYSDLPSGSEVRVFIDSQYVIRSTRSLSPPEIGYNSDCWLSKRPQEQSEFLTSNGALLAPFAHHLLLAV